MLNIINKTLSLFYLKENILKIRESLLKVARKNKKLEKYEALGDDVLRWLRAYGEIAEVV